MRLPTCLVYWWTHPLAFYGFPPFCIFKKRKITVSIQWFYPSKMDLVTRNVLRHVYEALLARKRQADSGNISNLQLFYNRLISEYCASEKRGQCLVVPLTGQDVDDFYSRKMPREMFVELVRTKVRLLWSVVFVICFHFVCSLFINWCFVLY